MLMDYSIAYAGLYLTYGQRLCYTMLKHYAETGRIEAPVPSYRGFHVRPTTLVARIVQHYGSDIKMELDGQIYDAGSPMDIFRANEKINAQKRRWLVSEIGRFSLPKGDQGDGQIRATVLDLVLKLAEQGKLIIYQQPLQLSAEFGGEGILLEKVTQEIAKLQATGQIDINAEALAITFIGDKRVLRDLELLAQSGYGEDHCPIRLRRGPFRQQYRAAQRAGLFAQVDQPASGARPVNLRAGAPPAKAEDQSLKAEDQSLSSFAAGAQSCSRHGISAPSKGRR